MTVPFIEIFSSKLRFSAFCSEYRKKVLDGMCEGNSILVLIRFLDISFGGFITL